MSRSDYIFLGCLGQKYREKAEEFERKRLFECSAENYKVAGECFEKAEEIAKSDLMQEHGASALKKSYCQRKSKEMKVKSIEQESSASFRHSGK